MSFFAVLRSDVRDIGSVSAYRDTVDVCDGPLVTINGDVVEVEVTPERVKGWFDPTDAKPIPFADLPAGSIERWYTSPNDAADAVDPNNGMTVPQWSSRGGLGVWSYDSAVALRNVTVSPLK